MTTKKIFKYSVNKFSIDKFNRFSIIFPKGAEILHIHTQKDFLSHSNIENICFWALVDPSEPESEVRTFEIRGTGHEIQFEMGYDLKYVSTVHLEGGALVFHIFEVV
jgi:hypothetical protein